MYVLSVNVIFTVQFADIWQRSELPATPAVLLRLVLSVAPDIAACAGVSRMNISEAMIAKQNNIFIPLFIYINPT